MVQIQLLQPLRQLRRWYQKENKNGRPLKYNKVEEIKKDIDKYFKECDKKMKPYTVSGLAYALDMSRQSLLNYENKDEFFDTIKKAKDKIEAQLEENALLGRYNPTFTIFNLKNNYGWQDKQEIDTTVSNKIEIINDLPSDVDED